MPESVERKPENKSIPLAGANPTGNGGVAVINPGCKDISSEGVMIVEKPVQKDAANVGIGVEIVKQSSGKVKSEVKDKISAEKTALVVDTAAPEGAGAGRVAQPGDSRCVQILQCLQNQLLLRKLLMR